MNWVHYIHFLSLSYLSQFQWKIQIMHDNGDNLRRFFLFSHCCCCFKNNLLQKREENILRLHNVMIIIIIIILGNIISINYALSYFMLNNTTAHNKFIRLSYSDRFLLYSAVLSLKMKKKKTTT